jgi:hypothetical protein
MYVYMSLLRNDHLFSTDSQPQCDSELPQAADTASYSQTQTVRWRPISSGPQLNATN